MKEIHQIIDELTNHQQEIIQKASEPGSTILFNIKGMVQVLHAKGPFDFIEMGYEDIKLLKKKGLIDPIKDMKHRNVLEGEEYVLSTLGRDIAKIIMRSF